MDYTAKTIAANSTTAKKHAMSEKSLVKSPLDLFHFRIPA